MESASNVRHILIIDDDPYDLLYLSELIEQIDDKYTYIIHAAANAEDAIIEYSLYPIECAIIDYNLPVNNGVEIIHILNRLPRSHISVHEKLPVVVISGVGNDSMIANARQADALHFITKNDLTSSQRMKLVIDDMLCRSERRELNSFYASPLQMAS